MNDNVLGPNNARNRAHRENRVERNKLYIRFIKATATCKDCGSRQDLTFDHPPGAKKVGNVADMVHTHSFLRLSEEVAKCEIVCWPCHIEREKVRILRGLRVKRNGKWSWA